MGLVRFVGYYPSGLGKNDNSIIVITDTTFEFIFGVSSNNHQINCYETIK